MNASAQKYNGWTNYETWNYALWLNNDQGSQEYWNERAQEAFNDAEADGAFTRKENAAFVLREQLKDEAEAFISENLPQNLQCCWLADAVNAYISEVDWQEIAEHYLDDV